MKFGYFKHNKKMRRVNNIKKNLLKFENYFSRNYIKSSKGNFGKFLHPWLNSSKRINDIKKSLKLKKIISSQLINSLNQIHNEKNNENYWKFIINPFIEKIVTSLYEIDCIFNKLEKENKEMINFVYPKLDFNKINVDNYYEFTRTLDTIEIKSWITSFFFSYYKKKNKINLKNKNLFIPKGKKIDYNQSFLLQIYNNLSLFFFNNFYLTENKSLKNFLMILIKYKLIPFFITEKYLKTSLNQKLRKKIIFNLKNKKFEFVLNKIIPQLLPKSYLENYKYIKKNCNYNFLIKRQVFFDDGVLVNSDYAKIFIANAKKNSAIRFNMMQHGGGYHNKLNSYVLMEKNLSDKHYVWGKPIYSNQEQFLAPQIKHFLNINNSNSEEIIIPVSLPALFAKNMSASISGKCYENYFLDLIIFLTNLNYNIRKNVIVRFPPGAKILDYDLLIKKRFPEIKLDYGHRPFKIQLIKSKIAICTVDSTTILQSLVSGIPTIFFWRSNYFESKKFLNKEFLYFKKKNVFHNDPKRAAEFINKNHQKLIILWREIKNNKNFKSFLKKTCNL